MTKRNILQSYHDHAFKGLILQHKQKKWMLGFRRHLGCGAVATKITANVWDIVQLSLSIINSAIMHRILTKNIFSVKRY